jgi:hypothetical protein
MTKLGVLLTVGLLAFASAASVAAETKDKPKGKMSVALVLLSEAKLPKGEAIERAFHAYALDGQTLRAHAGTKKHGDLAALELDLDGGQVFVALMPAPVPKGEADAAARFSISAMNGKWKLPPHKAHLVVTAEGKGDTMARLAAFTSLLAAVAEASSAVGVYCGDAGATHDPKFVREIARLRNSAERLMVWSGVSISREGDRYSLLSLGMKTFGMPDLLLVVPRAKADDAIPKMFDLLAYAIDRGAALPEGDTVGPSENERWPVHYVPSPVDPLTKVWRIEVK